MLVPLLCFALGVFAAICAYAFGARWGAGIVLAAIILGGVVLSLVAPATFQGYLMLVGYGAGLVVLASGLGLTAGVQLKAKRYLLSVLLFLPFPYLIWTTQSNESKQTEEKALAFEFVMSNKQVAELAGGPFKVLPSSSTTYRGDSTPGRYEFAIVGSNPFNLILAVSRQSDIPKFSIACATKLSMGQREVGKDDCLQSPLPLPK
jgi:hypothetical protein